MKALDKLKKKQNESENGLDILTEVKEPFSMSGFFEEHVVQRAHRVKNLLKEKGILFFLFSPFQARNRLIAQIMILCIGVLFGVIPRASSMVNDLQDQAYASEISGLSKKTVGSISITPAASSNYKRLHMLAFVVEGKNLPSDASKYEVHLARSYGSSDWADVTYSWDVYPVTDSSRILLVAIDQSKQASGYGAFDLYIQLAGDDVAQYARTPFEITLSAAQDTSDLYDKRGVHLSALTPSICGAGGISDKEEKFRKALEKYQVALEQAENMPVDIKVEPTAEDLESYCLANRVYRLLEDNSTTEDILLIDPVGTPDELVYEAAITSDGIRYDGAYIKSVKDSGGYSEEESIVFDAFNTVDDAKKAVLSAMNEVNGAAVAWYNTLSNYKLILNQTIDISTFPLHARCTNTTVDDIDYIEGGMAGDEPETGTPDEGPVGTMTGDESEPVDEWTDDTDEEPGYSEPDGEEPDYSEPAGGEPEYSEPVSSEPVNEPDEPASSEPVSEPDEPAGSGSSAESGQGEDQSGGPFGNLYNDADNK